MRRSPARSALVVHNHAYPLIKCLLPWAVAGRARCRLASVGDRTKRRHRRVDTAGRHPRGVGVVPGGHGRVVPGVHDLGVHRTRGSARPTSGSASSPARRLSFATAVRGDGRFLVPTVRWVGVDVIVLNGGSSAGKSSIARALQLLLPVPWLTFGEDVLGAALPQSGANAVMTFGPLICPAFLGQRLLCFQAAFW